jgi:hypothetical protein
MKSDDGDSRYDRLPNVAQRRIDGRVQVAATETIL